MYQPRYRDDLDRNRTALAQAWENPPAQYEAISMLLVVITGSSLISGSTKRYTYSWQRASLTGTTAAAKSGQQTGTAISISELSNDATGDYSYGVDPTNLPGTFDAVAIPTGTFVLIVPYRDTTGALVWLIINTQAIDGACS